MAKRIFLQVELPSKEDRDAFRLWCQVNDQDMAERVRNLIARDIEEGKRLAQKLKGGQSAKIEEHNTSADMQAIDISASGNSAGRGCFD